MGVCLVIELQVAFLYVYYIGTSFFDLEKFYQVLLQYGLYSESDLFTVVSCKCGVGGTHGFISLLFK